MSALFPVSLLYIRKCQGRGEITLTLPAPTVITASLKVQLFEAFFPPSETVSVDAKLFQRKAPGYRNGFPP